MGEGPHPIPVEVIKMKPPISLYILLALLIVCAVAAFFSGSLEAAGLFTDPSVLFKRLIWPLMRATAFISIGLFVGLIIEGMGWTNRLAVIARPFMRWGTSLRSDGGGIYNRFCVRNGIPFHAHVLSSGRQYESKGDDILHPVEHVPFLFSPFAKDILYIAGPCGKGWGHIYNAYVLCGSAEVRNSAFMRSFYSS